MKNIMTDGRKGFIDYAVLPLLVVCVVGAFAVLWFLPHMRPNHPVAASIVGISVVIILSLVGSLAVVEQIHAHGWKRGLVPPLIIIVIGVACWFVKQDDRRKDNTANQAPEDTARKLADPQR
jgi:hypothetical protein